ncbi:DUF6161 domain-containing protein [Geothrix edaphica]|uniref:DUF6161 domain-containing protein n=1 Tax=Geothrix edaphica TaxID=2927976 RepID=A0ABQ5Q0R4_9BACT|nr:DUF6161 domain-containing protein [Geothrix edaphica]GLH68221.1 hypothetical protein GETHED_25850 [Geothrix edaphica]
MADELFLDLDLGTQFGRLRFKTFEEFQAWNAEESAAWNWLISVMNTDGNLTNALSQGQYGLRQQLQNLINNYHGNPNLYRSEIKNALENWVSGGRAFSSKMPIGKFVLELSKTSPVSAAWATAALTAPPVSLNMSTQSSQSLDGIFRAMLWRNGLKGTASSEKAALDELFIQASNHYSQNASKAEEQSALIQRQHEMGEEEIALFKNSAQAALDDSRQQFNDAIGVGQAQLDLISKTYEAQLALQAPVLYWKQKASKHFTALWCMVGVVLVAMVVGTLGLIQEVKVLLPTIQPGKWPEPWKLGLILISLTMAIWIIRILMKVMLSQLHLHTDADERAVMSNAYLALLKRGKAMQDDDRELILSVLFRPSATGIVDDGGPATPIEIITRAVQGKEK